MCGYCIGGVGENAREPEGGVTRSRAAFPRRPSDKLHEPFKSSVVSSIGFSFTRQE